MLEDVTKRLESFGYEVTEADNWMIEFLIQKIENSIKADCNINTIPEELHEIAVDMVVGEFLLNKKSRGQLEGFDLEAAVKQIHEGDTSVTFAIGDGSKTPEERLDELILYLMNYGKGKFAAYRCIKW
ncbi:MAG TPA: hypothetical protein PKN66_09515 [Thermodesulfovibrio thiophilus]|nr:hypothetical protein [Thermodesulfovibrio thiophilus]